VDTCTTGNPNLRGNGFDIRAASFHLMTFSPVSGCVRMCAEHGAAGRKAERNGNQGNKHEQIFHGSIDYGLGLKND